LIPLGLGGLSSVLATLLGEYKVLFIVLTFVLLGVSHYLVLEQRKATISSKITLWVATVVSISILIYSFVQS